MDDIQAAVDFIASEYPKLPLLLAGFSFGSWVGLCVGCGDPRVTHLIGLGLPVGDLVGDRGFDFLNFCGKPKLLVSGEFDMYGPPHKLDALVGQFPDAVREQTSVTIIRGADHFFAGHLEKLDRAISDWLAKQYPGLIENET